MSAKEARIIERVSGIQYCRRWNGTSYDNYDAAAIAYPGVATDLWGAASHVMYWGFDTQVSAIGFRLDTAADVATTVFGYSTTPDSWAAMTPIQNNIQNFEVDGWVAWKTPKPGTFSWDKHTHSGALPSAFWIRATISTYATTGKFLNFLRNIVLSPILLKVMFTRERLVPDINGVLRALDLTYDGPDKLAAEIPFPALVDADAKGMPNLTLLWEWLRTRRKLTLEDLAQSTPPDLTLDAIYSDYTGYLEELTPDAISPWKMRRSDVEFTMMLEAATAIL